MQTTTVMSSVFFLFLWNRMPVLERGLVPSRRRKQVLVSERFHGAPVPMAGRRVLARLRERRPLLPARRVRLQKGLDRRPVSNRYRAMRKHSLTSFRCPSRVSPRFTPQVAVRDSVPCIDVHRVLYGTRQQITIFLLSTSRGLFVESRSAQLVKNVAGPKFGTRRKFEAVDFSNRRIFSGERVFNEDVTRLNRNVSVRGKPQRKLDRKAL